MNKILTRRELMKIIGQSAKLQTMPRRLPILEYGGFSYLVDARQRRFREVGNPHRFIDFDSPEGAGICDRSVVIPCPFCGIKSVVYRDTLRDVITCWRCEGEFPIDLSVRWAE